MKQSWRDSRWRSAAALALARRSFVLEVSGATVAVLQGPEDRLLVSPRQFAPALPGAAIAVEDARFNRYWWPGPGSNRRPSAFQADARTN